MYDEPKSAQHILFSLDNGVLYAVVLLQCGSASPPCDAFQAKGQRSSVVPPPKKCNRHAVQQTADYNGATQAQKAHEQLTCPPISKGVSLWTPGLLRLVRR